jgi:pyruvate,orthophosphate dikinase
MARRPSASAKKKPAKARKAAKVARKSPKAAAKKAVVKKAARKSAKAAPAPARKDKWVYAFGGGKAEGRSEMKNLLGGKGANLAEMANLGLPVPPGFTITTEVCTWYYANKETYPPALAKQVADGLAHIARITGKTFGDAKNPLLVSVRSGARASMPGMMDTVLNLGLNDETVEAVAKLSGDRRFAYDSYRRFINMYSNVVLGIEHHNFEDILEDHKSRQGYTLDTELSADEWVEVVGRYKPFPQ